MRCFGQPSLHDDIDVALLLLDINNQTARNARILSACSAAEPTQQGQLPHVS